MSDYFLQPEDFGFDLSKIQFINTFEGLEDCFSELKNHNVVALDSEWDQANSTCVLQIGLPDRVFLVSLSSFSQKDIRLAYPLINSLLRNPQIKKLTWDFSQDILNLSRRFKESMRIIGDVNLVYMCKEIHFDIQLNPGLSSFCQFTLGKPLDKKECRSAWRKKELSESQMIYAAMDVIVLFQLMKVAEQNEWTIPTDWKPRKRSG